MPSSANTTADRNALRVRNSIAMSFRAMSHASRRISDIRSDQIVVIPGEARGFYLVAGLDPNQAAAIHYRCASRQTQALFDVVCDEDERRAAITQRNQKSRKRFRASGVEPGERLIGKDHQR